MDTIRQWLEQGDNLNKIDKIVFCVFQTRDELIYERLLDQYFPQKDAGGRMTGFLLLSFPFFFSTFSLFNFLFISLSCSDLFGGKKEPNGKKDSNDMTVDQGHSLPQYTILPSTLADVLNS